MKFYEARILECNISVVSHIYEERLGKTLVSEARQLFGAFSTILCEVTQKLHWAPIVYDEWKCSGTLGRLFKMRLYREERLSL